MMSYTYRNIDDLFPLQISRISLGRFKFQTPNRNNPAVVVKMLYSSFSKRIVTSPITRWVMRLSYHATKPTLIRLLLLSLFLPFVILRFLVVDFSSIVRNLIYVSFHPWVLFNEKYRLQIIKSSEVESEEDRFTMMVSHNSVVDFHQNIEDFQFQLSESDILRISEDEIESIRRIPNYRFTSKYVSIHDLNVHYIDVLPSDYGVRRNPKKTMLLVHGNPTWSYLYRNVISHFCREGYRCVALDFIGFGGSDKLRKVDHYSYRLHISTLIQFVEKLGLNDFVLVAHDWGGMLTELALTSERFARRISHLVLCDTTLPHYSFPSELSLKPLSLYLLWAASNSFFSTHLPTPLVHQYLSPGISPQDSLNYTVPYTTSKEKTGIVALAFMVPFSTFHNQYVYMWRNSAFGRLMEFVFPEFSRFLDSNYNLTLLGNKAKRKLAFKWDKPTLLMFGEDDQVMGSFKYPLSLTINRKAQQYSLSPIIISGAGHYPQEDEPQKFSEEILKFLKATEHEYRTVHHHLSKGSAVEEE